MILFIDNYDSFTFNLVHLFAGFRKDLVVLRNDDSRIFDYIYDLSLEAVVISPGPGRPEKSGLCLKMLERLSPKVFVFGVCLGHQILALYSGIRIKRSNRIMHGKLSLIYHTEASIFEKIKNPFPAARYHSLIMDEPDGRSIEVIARSEFDEPMALKYKYRPWIGVQFHPESVLTTDGILLVKNFFQIMGENKFTGSFYTHTVLTHKSNPLM